jgi:hypothetical protein
MRSYDGEAAVEPEYVVLIAKGCPPARGLYLRDAERSSGKAYTPVIWAAR